VSQSKGKKGPRSSSGKQQPEAKGKSSRVSWVLVGLAAAVALAGIYLVFMRQGPASKGTESPPPPEAGSADFQVLVGKWMRPDGGYIIAVQGVDPDGRVDAGYFNPRPINVSRAEASAEGKTIKLFLELQGMGYPGSTYELTYDPKNDVLFGIYFQAAMQQRFDVVFVRRQ
jgi:hypothetical protein